MKRCENKGAQLVEKNSIILYAYERHTIMYNNRIVKIITHIQGHDNWKTGHQSSLR
jgi:hypothetical protein